MRLPSRISTTCTLLIIAASLGACSRKEAHSPAPAPAAKPAVPAAAQAPAGDVPYEAASLGKQVEGALMQAIYEEEYDAATGAALTSILADGDYGDYLMKLVSANTLPDGRTVVIVNGAPSDEEGTDLSAHASGGMLNVYVASFQEGAWTVLERYENLDLTGSNGSIGSIKWVALAPGKQGFILSSGGVWQGSAMRLAAIYDLGEGVRYLGGFKEMSSNAGACTPDAPECWEVGSTMRFVAAAPASAYRDVLVEFTEKRYTVSEDAKGDVVEHPSAPVRHTMRYRFDGKQYVPASGVNPVPDI